MYLEVTWSELACRSCPPKKVSFALSYCKFDKSEFHFEVIVIPVLLHVIVEIDTSVL
jgi:hypothetical protein